VDSLFKAVTRQRQDQDLNHPDVGPVVMYTVRDHRISQMTLALPRVTLPRQRSASVGLLRNQAHERVQALADISRSALCCHSNETRAPTTNPPNRAQLGGTPYHSPKLHPGPCSSAGMRRGTERHTDGRSLRLTRNEIVMIIIIVTNKVNICVSQNAVFRCAGQALMCLAEVGTVGDATGRTVDIEL